MKSKKLTFLESLMLVAGAGIGTGILTIPYAISKIGMPGTILALVIAYAVSAVMYLMIADLTLHSKKSTELLGILQEHLFYGKNGQILTTIFFVVLVVLLLENLVVYILCAQNVMIELIPMDENVAKIFFYIIASSVIFFGMKGVGIGEKYSVTLIGIVVLVLIVLSALNPKNSLQMELGDPQLIFALYGLFMFAFSAIFSVIQVCNHIERKEQTKKAILGGLSLNAVLTLLFAIAVMIGSDEVTEIATIGLTESLGLPIIKMICGLFVLMAMFSSFWSSGFAFADVVGEQFKMGPKSAWFVSTIPTVLIAIFLPLSILEYIQIGAGALSIILVIVVLPAYYHAMLQATDKPMLGRFARSKILIGIVGICVGLMAVASLIPIG